MRQFHYSTIKEQKWDSEILGLIAAIYKKQESKSFPSGKSRKNLKSW